MIADARSQPNGWTCGPAALRHALLYLGRRVSIRRLARLAGTTRADGTDAPALRTAAAFFGLHLGHEIRRSPRGAQALLRRHLAAGVPVLLAVDRDETGHGVHWVTALAANGRKVCIADSARYYDARGRLRPGPVLRRLTWREFLGRWCCYHPGETRFDLYPVLP